LEVRIEAACRQLQTTTKGVEQIARAAGFGSADVMRRAFLRTIGTTPKAYRLQYRS